MSSQQQQQHQASNPYAGSNRSNTNNNRQHQQQQHPPPNAWQQPPPFSQQQQQQQPPPPQYIPHHHQPPPRMAYYTPYPNPYAHPQPVPMQHPQQQQQQQAQRPAGLWQPAPPPTTTTTTTTTYPQVVTPTTAVGTTATAATTTAATTSSGGFGGRAGTMYYPPPQQQQVQQQQQQRPAPPKRRTLVITDKQGNVLDFSSNKKKSTTTTPTTTATAPTTGSSSTTTTTTAETATTTTTTTAKAAAVHPSPAAAAVPSSSSSVSSASAASTTTSTAAAATASQDATATSAGSKLRQAALERIAQMDAAKAASEAAMKQQQEADGSNVPSQNDKQQREQQQQQQVPAGAGGAVKSATTVSATPSYAEKLKSKQSQQQQQQQQESAATTPDLETSAVQRQAEEEKKAKLEAQQQEEAKKKAEEEKAKRQAEEEKAKRQAEESARRAAEEKAKKEAEERTKRAAEEKAKREAEEEAKHQAAAVAEEEAKQRQAADQASSISSSAATEAGEPPKRPSFLQKLQAKKEAAGLGTARGNSSLSAMASKLDAQQQQQQQQQQNERTPSPPRTGTLRPSGGIQKPASLPSSAAVMASSTNGSSKRRVFTKQELLRFKELDICCCRPMDLPDMTIERIPVGGGGGGRGRRESWQRGAPPPRDSQRRVSATAPQQEPKQQQQQQQWARGVAPPPAPPPGQQQRGGPGGQRGGRGGPPFLDGPVAPLVKSENRWRPKKNVDALVVAEKQVKSILNKMTKEKFDKLSTQMCEIPILSYDMLTMMIHNVYEKAIDEPSFGDMYADLCAKLSQTAKQGTPFIKIIPSDEEPPTDGEAATGESSSYKVYRWSNDVSTTDAEIVGPYGSPEECTEAALSGEDLEPSERGDMTLELHSLAISNGNFIKIMKKKDEDSVYYVVYFPVAEHQECGQQLSKIFLSERECMSDAVKQNSFKRSLLNKCQDEFDKQDIYVDWKAEKKSYEETKSSLTEAEQAEKEEELSFRRMKIKKQMLGNIKFIGQLYKKGLLKEKIMRYCIGSLLKLEVIDNEAKNPEYKDSGDMDLDEEDHEAACSMFATIGKTIDRPGAQIFMTVCFTKMEKLSNDKTLSSRSRFMYKDLLELRANYWEPRRKTEKAKTIEEIRKDFEREERLQEQQSRQMGGYRGGGGRGGDRRDYGDRRDDRRDSRRDYGGGGNRGRNPKPPAQPDEDGFTLIGARGGGGRPAPAPTAPVRIATRPSTSRPAASPPPTPSKVAPKPPSPEPAKNDGPAPLSKDKLERRIDTIRSEFMQDPSNVKELLLSFDELSGTPDAGFTLVSRNGDRIFDCKDAERKAITDMLVLLVERDKLSKDNVSNGLAEVVEFIDSFVIDSPKAYEYIADVLSAMIKVEALDALWLCQQAEKLKQMEPDKVSHEKLVRKTMEAMKERYGTDAVKSAFAGTDKSRKLGELLGADKWNDMANEIMS